ncbi:hypothetical protein CEXT_256981 [Caerostris extrusa]|uniref:Uncharacterized protein n=1 Tax=Caerostris extrusa TaxID=172846 RepID=A0AAV4VK01_CAEEX|nr:hypothetical protein CEXT_256981 [Caerostris extrusa]
MINFSKQAFHRENDKSKIFQWTFLDTNVPTDFFPETCRSPQAVRRRLTSVRHGLSGMVARGLAHQEAIFNRRPGQPRKEGFRSRCCLPTREGQRWGIVCLD